MFRNFCCTLILLVKILTVRLSLLTSCYVGACLKLFKFLHFLIIKTNKFFNNKHQVLFIYCLKKYFSYTNLDSLLQSLLDFNNHVKVRTCINNNEYFKEINKIYLKRIRKCMHVCMTTRMSIL